MPPGWVFFCFVFLFFCCFFETGFLYIALAVLELTLRTRLALNSEICLPSAGIKGVRHHTGLVMGFLFLKQGHVSWGGL